MRISDWSSDVCSSDLLPSERPPQVDAIGPGRRDGRCIEERSHGEATEGIALVGQVSGPQCERPAHIALIACPEVEKHMTFLLEEFGVRAVDIVRTAIGQLGNDKEFTVRARLLTHISNERSGPALRANWEERREGKEGDSK